MDWDVSYCDKYSINYCLIVWGNFRIFYFCFLLMLMVLKIIIKFFGGVIDGFFSGLMIECGILNENSIL